MNEVPSQIVFAILKHVEGLGHPVAPLVRGLPLSAKLSPDDSGRADWTAFAQMLERIERRVGQAGLRDIGAGVVAIFPQSAVMKDLGVTAREAYELINGHVCPWLWPQIEARQRFIGADRVRLELAFPKGWRGCEPWFELTFGTERAIPTIVGDPPAEIDARLGATEGRYDIRFEKPRGRRRVGPSTIELFKAMLAGQREEVLWTIQLSNGELGRAKELRERATLMGVAWGLSERQVECLRLVGLGRSNGEIARALRLSTRAVGSEVRALLERSGLRERASLIQRFWHGYRPRQEPGPRASGRGAASAGTRTGGKGITSASIKAGGKGNSSAGTRTGGKRITSASMKAR
ncbi:MAG: helix-turn-helix transcriptional regulator, partial [Deltaproteobacteria bacterium]